MEPETFKIGDSVFVNDKCSVLEFIGYFGTITKSDHEVSRFSIEGHLDPSKYKSTMTNLGVFTRSLSLLVLNNRAAIQCLHKR